jgi:hypothetical protein
MQPKKNSFKLTQPNAKSGTRLTDTKSVKKAATKSGVAKFFSDFFSAITFRNGL